MKDCERWLLVFSTENFKTFTKKVLVNFTIFDNILRREGGSRAKKMIFLLALTSYRVISLVSKIGSFFSQVAAVFLLRTEK